MTLSALFGCGGGEMFFETGNADTAEAPTVVVEEDDMKGTLVADMREIDPMDRGDMRVRPPVQEDMAAEDMRVDLPEPDMKRPSRALATGVAIRDILAYQTIEVPLVQGAASAVSQTPLVANRDVLVRVLVDLEGAPVEVDANLVIQAGGSEQRFEQSRRIERSSIKAERGSAIEFRVPRDLIAPDAVFRVELLGEGGVDADTSAQSSARWPQDGSSQTLGIRDDMGKLTVVLVPFRYDYDGTGRMPDLSEAQMQRYNDAVRAIYPAADFEILIHPETQAWTSRVDWFDFNARLRDLKAATPGSEEHYYYGLISPAEDFVEYCVGTCTTGQSYTVSNASAKSYRVGTGMGWGGERWTWTMVHELGHMHGRGHARCGVSFFSQDRSYPYSNGESGVWGWDSRTDELHGPDDTTDFMGYCDKLWVSDYTYDGILERMYDVAALDARIVVGPARKWRYLYVGAQTPGRWGHEIWDASPHTGELAVLSVRDPGSRRWSQRAMIPYAPMGHESASTILVPAEYASASELKIELPSGAVLFTAGHP